MRDSFVNYLALGAAALALLAGIAAVKRGGSRFGTRSALVFAAAALVAAVGFGLALVLDSTVVFAVAATVAMLTMAIGILTHSSETAEVGKIADEQRVDHVSGLPNERLFRERLNAEHSRTKRTRQSYSVAVFEIDNYALLSESDKINGMKLLADSLLESIRNTDTLGRLGEDQVAVLLVDTLADGASIGCDRACERFFFQSCGHSDAAHVTRPLTVSVGIASFGDDTVDPMHVVDNARLAVKRLRDDLESGIRIYDAASFTRAGAPGDELALND